MVAVSIVGGWGLRRIVTDGAGGGQYFLALRGLAAWSLFDAGEGKWQVGDEPPMAVAGTVFLFCAL